MIRVGYDSDTGRYHFQDRDGVVWQGAEGAEFGEMTRGEMFVGVIPSSPQTSFSIVSNADVPLSEEAQEEDLEAAPTRTDGYRRVTTDPVRVHPHCCNYLTQTF